MENEEKWIEISKFRGETIGALKAINKELSEIKQEQRYLREEFGNHCIRYTELRSKVASIAAGISIVTSIGVAVATMVLSGVI